MKWVKDGLRTPIITLFAVATIQCPPTYAAAPDLAPMPTGRRMFVAAAIDGRIHCIGGNERDDSTNVTVDAYDVKANVWSKRAPWPTPSSYPCGAAALGRLFVVGAPSGNVERASIVQQYEPKTDSWKRLADLPVARSHSAATAKEDKVYVLGGHGRRKGSELSEPGADFSDVWILDARNGTWSPGPALPTATHGHAAATLNETIHLVGGLVDPTQHFALIRGKWEKRARPPFDVVKTPMATVEGKLVLIGGGNSTTETAVYDPIPDKWTMAAPTRRTRFLSQCVGINDKAFALGGVSEGSNSHKALEVFDLRSSRWND